jgi:hypothetical protein
LRVLKTDSMSWRTGMRRCSPGRGLRFAVGRAQQPHLAFGEEPVELGGDVALVSDDGQSGSMSLADALKTRDPTRGHPRGDAPVLVATVVPDEDPPKESAMSTTEDHGGAGRMTARPEQGAPKARGSRSWSPIAGIVFVVLMVVRTFSVAVSRTRPLPRRRLPPSLADGANYMRTSSTGGGR